MNIFEVLTDYRIRLNTLLLVKEIMNEETSRYRKDLLETERDIKNCILIINNIEGALNVLIIDSML